MIPCDFERGRLQVLSGYRKLQMEFRVSSCRLLQRYLFRLCEISISVSDLRISRFRQRQKDNPNEGKFDLHVVILSPESTVPVSRRLERCYLTGGKDSALGVAGLWSSSKVIFGLRRRLRLFRAASGEALHVARLHHWGVLGCFSGI